MSHPEIDDIDRWGLDLLKRIEEYIKKLKPNEKNGWRPLLFAAQAEISRLREELNHEMMMRDYAELTIRLNDQLWPHLLWNHLSPLP